MTSALFALLGALAGVAEVWLLWRETVARPSPLGMMVRLLMVGSVLVAGAAAAQLIPAGAGWAMGFAASGAIVAGKAR